MYITARLAASQPVPARPGTSCLLLCAFTLQLPVYVRGWVRRGICFSLWFFFPFSQVVYHQAMPWLQADCLVWVGLRNVGEFVPAWPGRRLLPTQAGGDAGRLGSRPPNLPLSKVGKGAVVVVTSVCSSGQKRTDELRNSVLQFYYICSIKKVSGTLESVSNHRGCMGREIKISIF